MKRFKHIYALVLAAFALSVTGCNPELEPQAPKTIEFTVRYSDVSYNYAVIDVKHNGPEDITWYGFVTEEVGENDFKLYYKKYQELLKSGKVTGLKKETERNILLENLKEETQYKYIVFGITENGELYDNVGIGSIQFKTSKNIYILNQTNDWTFTYLGRDDTRTKDIIEVKAASGGRFGWQYVSKESIEDWDKENPDGFEIWDEGTYMATVNGIEMFVLSSISSIQQSVASGQSTLAELTYVYEPDNPFELNRLTSGEYYLVAYGFMSDGQHTQNYSVMELTIEEEVAEDAYNQWLGTYTMSGEVETSNAEGEIVKETRSYDIKIEAYDNNHMYRIHGWECGNSVDYDWEEDIMQLDKDKGEFLAFPAYYDNGKLVIKESSLTYITFDGVETFVMGIYGYANVHEMNVTNEPLFNESTTMAIAEPIATGQNSTQLIGQSSQYRNQSTGKVELTWDYTKMGYIAYNENRWMTINPPMSFPITITKTDSADATEPSISPAVMNKTTFNAQKVADKFFKKDFSISERKKPEVFHKVK